MLLIANRSTHMAHRIPAREVDDDRQALQNGSGQIQDSGSWVVTTSSVGLSAQGWMVPPVVADRPCLAAGANFGSDISRTLEDRRFGMARFS